MAGRLLLDRWCCREAAARPGCGGGSLPAAAEAAAAAPEAPALTASSCNATAPPLAARAKTGPPMTCAGCPESGCQGSAAPRRCLELRGNTALKAASMLEPTAARSFSLAPSTPPGAGGSPAAPRTPMPAPLPLPRPPLCAPASEAPCCLAAGSSLGAAGTEARVSSTATIADSEGFWDRITPPSAASPAGRDAAAAGIGETGAPDRLAAADRCWWCPPCLCHEPGAAWAPRPGPPLAPLAPGAKTSRKNVSVSPRCSVASSADGGTAGAGPAWRPGAARLTRLSAATSAMSPGLPPLPSSCA